MKLRDFQTSFTKDLFHCQAQEIRGALQTPESLINKRFYTYINNVFLSLGDSLGATFPKVKESLGEDVFKTICTQFIHEHPPQSGCLHHYGSKFPSYLREFKNIKNREALRELAFLEWTVYELEEALDSVPLEASDIEQIQRLSPEEILEIKVQFPKACLFWESSYTVARYYREETEEMLKAHSPLLAIRPEWTVNVFSLSPENFIFLKSLFDGNTLFKAHEMTSSGSDFPLDLQGILHFALENKFFTSFEKGES